VAMDTLDRLVARYGRPAFVKIDVEGFEDQVIAGLSSPVGALSMEFTPEFLNGALRCVDHLCSIAKVQFQISLGESMEFALPDWVEADEVKQRLHRVNRPAFGDLYARFVTS